MKYKNTRSSAVAD